MEEEEELITLKSLRSRTGFLQKEIQTRTKNSETYIPQSSLSDWELGKKVPDANDLLALRYFYRCSKEEILTAWENTKQVASQQKPE
jgi:hypothetical protein